LTTLNLVENILKAEVELARDVFSQFLRETAPLLSFEQIKELSASNRGKLKIALLAVLSAGLSEELPDSRDSNLQPGQTPYGPHKVYRFFVPAGKETVDSQVRDLLNKYEFNSLTSKFKLNSRLKGGNELVHFKDSNNKARNRGYAEAGDKTTQDEDFQATGNTFADDRVAVLFCARLVNKARGLGLDLAEGPDHWESSQANIFNQLSEGEREILKQLRVGGIRTCSGALFIDGDGLLRAEDFHGFFFDKGNPYRWAVGARRPSRNQK
jgi:hypothetical protein